MRITGRRAQELLEMLEEVREECFRGRDRDRDRAQKYPYTEWERRRSIVKERLRSLPGYVRRAVDAINREERSRGRPPKLDLERRVNLFLLTRLLGRSNRGMEEAMELFRPLLGIDVSYKYVERLYSDRSVRLALHNLFMLLVKDEGATGSLSGDGTGYSVRVEDLYRLEPRKKGRRYLYFFSLIDLGTGMYVGCGHSRR